MVTVIAMPDPGALGFVISGRLTRADYENVLLPPVRDAIERGDRIRLLVVIEDFRGLEAGALRDELLAAAKLGRGQRGPSPRFAVVSDIDWVRRGVALFGWMIPGQARVFGGDGRAEAEAWLAA